MRHEPMRHGLWNVEMFVCSLIENKPIDPQAYVLYFICIGVT